jgi:hypothetical protein
VIRSSSRTRVAAGKASKSASVTNLLGRAAGRPTGQPELGVRLERADSATEDVGRGDVDLVEQEEAPLAARQEVHHLGRSVRPLRRVGDHRVGRDDDTGRTGELEGDRRVSNLSQDIVLRAYTRPTASFSSAVKTEICLSWMFEKWRNCCFHCMTETLRTAKDRNESAASVNRRAQKETYAEVQRTSVLFLIVHAAVMPTSVLPAPHGRTMMPLRARLSECNRVSGRSSSHRATAEDGPVAKHL